MKLLTTPKSVTTATESTTPMEASGSATMEAAPAAATAVAATTVLSVGWVWGKRETNEGCKRYQRLEKSGRAHNLYLPYDVGAPRRAGA